MHVQFTVSTVDSTETDRRIASRLVNTPHEQKRYQDLIPLLSESTVNEKRKRKIIKKVDPNYLARKQLGPSVQDLSLLYVPNPVVEVKFKLDRGGGDRGVERSGESSSIRNLKSMNPLSKGNNYSGIKAGAGAGAGGGGSIAGLESSIDPVTLLPKFSFDIKYVLPITCSRSVSDLPVVG